MSVFFERVRAALAPKGYEVLRELGSGGMGIVVLARQVNLDRLVAVKVIRPEMHTAVATERFLVEAKTLAILSHDHIVPVYDADEAGGLPYYAMKYLDGATVAHRVRTGPLPSEEVRKLGRDLLDALEFAHTHGVIHRDVKPANVFWDGKSAVLVDFGIAKRVPLPGQAPQQSGDPLTEPGVRPGTRGYMSPEQLAGAEATAGSDLFAAALVIYEAYSARHWLDAQQRGWRVRSRIPWLEARVLRRALAWKADERWRDAASFRRALWHARERRYQLRAILLTIGGLVVGVVATARWGDQLLGFFRQGPRIQIERLSFAGPPTEQALGDSISCALAVALRKYPDLAARGACDPPWGWFRRKTIFAGQVHTTGDEIQVTLGPRRASWRVAQATTTGSWRHDVNDLAAVLFDSLVGGSTFLEPSLPRAVMPKNPVARKAFLDGEHLLAQAKWGEAYAAYGEAATADGTCWMCFWRHAEVGRWLGLAQDSADVAPYRRSVALFPPQYRGLIAAEGQPLSSRIQGFAAVVRRWPDFFFGQFRFADEMFHRGPLVGHERREAVTPFTDVLRERRGDFAPAWEHLAMVSIADGDSVAADEAMVQLRATGPSRAAVTVQIRALVEVAFACRFSGSGQCRSVIQAEMRGAEAAGGTTIDAGARWLPYFDGQAGAITLGRILQSRAQLTRSALLAQAFGALGLGRVDSARAALRRATDRFGEPGLALFDDELEAMLLVFDPDSARLAGWSRVQASLAERASLPTTPLDERHRAAWMLAIASYRLGASGEASRAPRPRDGQPLPWALERLVSAVEAASRGDPREALTLSQPLIEIEAQASDPDPFFRTVLHLLRADWYERAGSREGERRELVWYQNSDVYRYPVNRPQLAEVDWAFGTLARWRLARLLDRGDAACRAYRDVQRLWASGDPLYRARADSAARRLVTLGCQAAG